MSHSSIFPPRGHRPGGLIRAVLFGCALLAVATPGFAAAAHPVQTRCGWFDNPTPGNAWLIDRDGEWTVSLQGGAEAEGPWPDFSPAQWTATNGPHGHGCACLVARVDPGERRVLRILQARARPAAACRAEPGLKEPR